MKLIAIEPFLDKYFEAHSRPTQRTVKRWILEGHLPARRVGKFWYVDEHRWVAAGNPLVERVLKAG